MFAAVTAPASKYNWVVGPRIGTLWTGSSIGSRVDVNVGAETTLWFLNEFGPGAAFDLVVPANQPADAPKLTWPFHSRAELYLGTRLFHLGETGAMSVRFGAIYNSDYRWSGRIGVVFEWPVKTSPPSSAS
jgi:hypothetical protein